MYYKDGYILKLSKFEKETLFPLGTLKINIVN
jgi:hypothetical protein